MFGNFTAFVMGFGETEEPVAAEVAGDANDEEIAFQLQLEAIAEFHQQSRLESQRPSACQDGASSSGSQAASCSTEAERCSESPVSTRPMSILERMFRSVVQNPRLTADEDGSTSGSTSVDENAILEMECVICTEMRPYTTFMSTTGCTHEYCFYCCQHYAEEKIASGGAQIQCPHDGCLHDFHVHQCSELLSPASFEILTTRQTEAAIPSSLKVYCPFKDCSAFMENSNGERGSRFVECGSCHRGFCLNCKIPWHANLTCSQYRGDVENRSRSGDEKLSDLAKKEKWQSCPVCKRLIELKEGCYHITCLCGIDFCYTCGAKWKNKAATCKCKLWDESNIIRQTLRRPRRIRNHAPFY